MECNHHAIVVKFGGSLITNKNSITPSLRTTILASLAQALRQAIDTSNISAIYLVIGAGSFGHPRSKRWNLAHGRTPNINCSGDSGDSGDSECKTQWDAVRLVRQEMLALASHVMAALNAERFSVVAHPPHTFARNVGPAFQGNLTNFVPRHRHEIALTWGDPVDCDEPQQFGILSGDDIVVRLATEMPHVRRLVFCMGGGVDGILRHPPGSTTTTGHNDLITEWCPATIWEGEHDANVDVTGGIGLKAARGSLVSNMCPHVHVQIINGEIHARVLDALVGRQAIGTTIRARPRDALLKSKL
jgi:isopentenyl phosphate kinase